MAGHLSVSVFSKKTWKYFNYNFFLKNGERHPEELHHLAKFTDAHTVLIFRA